MDCETLKKGFSVIRCNGSVAVESIKTWTCELISATSVESFVVMQSAPNENERKMKNVRIMNGIFFNTKVTNSENVCCEVWSVLKYIRQYYKCKFSRLNATDCCVIMSTQNLYINKSQTFSKRYHNEQM